MLRRFILWSQVVFSYALLIWTLIMFIRCIVGVYETFYCIMFALFSLLAYWLVCITRSELKGGKV